MKRHRKIEHIEKICRAQELGSYAQGQGHNQVKGQIVPKIVLLINYGSKGLGSIRGVFGPMSKISFTLSNYSFVIWDKNYRRYFVI